MSAPGRPKGESPRAQVDGSSPNEPPNPRTVPCPTCRRPAAFGPANPWRPFCGERCRSVDLGAWASEGYRVAAPEPPADGADDARH